MKTAITCLSIALLFVTIPAVGQDDSQEARASIAGLVEGLQKAITAGNPVDQFFSPKARIEQKAEISALDTRGFLNFQIVDYSLKELQFGDPQHASLAVTVKWSTRREEASTTTTLRFIKEQGAWYFANADFWEVSMVWFLPPIVYGAMYGAGLVFMYLHSKRQQWANVRKKRIWRFLSFIPGSLLFYWTRKPWSRARGG